MKSFKLFHVLCLLTFCGCDGKSTIDTKKIGPVQCLQGDFVKHFKLLDSFAQRSLTDTVRCCIVSIEFMEKNTGIEAHTDGSYAGPLDFLKSDLEAWRKWDDSNMRDSL